MCTPELQNDAVACIMNYTVCSHLDNGESYKSLSDEAKFERVLEATKQFRDLAGVNQQFRAVALGNGSGLAKSRIVAGLRKAVLGHEPVAAIDESGLMLKTDRGVAASEVARDRQLKAAQAERLTEKALATREALDDAAPTALKVGALALGIGLLGHLAGSWLRSRRNDDNNREPSALERAAEVVKYGGYGTVGALAVGGAAVVEAEHEAATQSAALRNAANRIPSPAVLALIHPDLANELRGGE